MPFRNSAVVASTLATALTGNRVVITGPNPGGGLPTALVQLFTGQEGASGAPGSLTSVANTGPILAVNTVLTGATEQSRAPSIALQGEVGVGDPVLIGLTADVVSGTTGPHQSASIPGGEVPMMVATSGTQQGSAYNPLNEWPMMAIRSFNINTDAASTITIPFGCSFPNGIGLVLPVLTTWGGGGPFALQFVGITTSQITYQAIKTTTAGASGPGVAMIGCILVMGW